MNLDHSRQDKMQELYNQLDSAQNLYTLAYERALTANSLTYQLGSPGGNPINNSENGIYFAPKPYASKEKWGKAIPTDLLKDAITSKNIGTVAR